MNHDDSERQTPNPKVSELLNRRDAAALEDLILWYRPMLRAMADRDLEKMLRPKMDVSDVVQEACKDIAGNFSRIKANDRIQFVGYLRAVLKNKIEDVRRRFLRSQKRSVCREQPWGVSGSNSDQDFVDTTISTIDKLFNDEQCDRLRKVLSQMPRELQRVLRWRFRKELTYKQIGDRLQRSEDEVRMLINRCLARMKSEVFPDG